MTRETSKGECDKCSRDFSYYLVHNGLNASSYAYCSACGMTALLDTNYVDRTSEGIPPYRAITTKGEHLLGACPCGGSFHAGASPRCPHCKNQLSATAATNWIEKAAPGADKGWKWQRDW